MNPIKTKYQTINNKECKAYYMEVEKVTEDDRHYFEIIENEIPEDKLILHELTTDWDDGKIYRVYTKNRKLWDKELEILELLYDEGLKVDTCEIDLKEDGWLEINPWFSYSEGNLMKLKELLKAKTFEVCFDGHMERQFLMYKLEI